MRRIIPISERFWAKVDKREPDECWPWLGHRGRNGMGQIGVGRRDQGVMYSARLSWELANGPIPLDKHVLHHCDNPPCVNPAHLFLGTKKDNTRDMLDKRRHSHGAKHPGAKLSPADVLAIRASTASEVVLATQYGVTRGAIYKIQRHKMWRCV